MCVVYVFCVDGVCIMDVWYMCVNYVYYISVVCVQCVWGVCFVSYLCGLYVLCVSACMVCVVCVT